MAEPSESLDVVPWFGDRFVVTGHRYPFVLVSKDADVSIIGTRCGNSIRPLTVQEKLYVHDVLGVETTGGVESEEDHGENSGLDAFGMAPYYGDLCMWRNPRYPFIMLTVNEVDHIVGIRDGNIVRPLSEAEAKFVADNLNPVVDSDPQVQYQLYKACLSRNLEKLLRYYFAFCSSMVDQDPTTFELHYDFGRVRVSDEMNLGRDVFERDFLVEEAPVY